MLLIKKNHENFCDEINHKIMRDNYQFSFFINLFSPFDNAIT